VTRLTIDGRRVDVHYRDLDVVEHELAEAEQGRFHVEPLLFHLAGIPSYMLAAELAINEVLHGTLPRPAAYPEKLRHTAHARWHDTARMPRLRQDQPRPERPPHGDRGRHRHGRHAGRARGAENPWRTPS
jgi:hypothetical protein